MSAATVSGAGTALRDASTCMLDARNLSVRLGNMQVLEDVSLDLRAHELRAVVGPSGAGKTSLLEALSGGCEFQAGHVTLHGERFDRLSLRQATRAGIARCFQDIRLFPTLSVRENLLVARSHLFRSGVLAQALALPAARSEEASHRARVEELATNFGLADVLDEAAGRLPYATRKLVGLVRALAMEPRILLLDEPLAGLNAAEKLAMRATLKHLRGNDGPAILLTENDIDFALGFAHRIVVLSAGRVVADGTPMRIRRNPDVRAAYAEVLDRLMEARQGDDGEEDEEGSGALADAGDSDVAEEAATNAVANAGAPR